MDKHGFCSRNESSLRRLPAEVAAAGRHARWGEMRRPATLSMVTVGDASSPCSSPLRLSGGSSGRVHAPLPHITRLHEGPLPHIMRPHTSSSACSHRPADLTIAASTACIRSPPHILGGWRHDALLILRSRATSCRGGSRHMCSRSGGGRLDPTSSLYLVLDRVSVESKVKPWNLL
jgi:hypothetical protein